VNSHRRIHWRLVLLAGFLAEVAIMVVFFVLLTIATLAGVPEVARPESTLDFIDAMVSSFVMMFLFTLWVGKRIESDYVLHGVLIGLTGFLLFTTLIVALSGSLAQPPLYLVAHGLKIAGGITGGIVAKRRSLARRTLLPT
jgi:CDP-diglyceride synthetase